LIAEGQSASAMASTIGYDLYSVQDESSEATQFNAPSIPPFQFATVGIDCYSFGQKESNNSMRLLTTLTLLIALMGCDGSQRGKFVVGSTGSVYLDPSLAHLNFFRGTRNPIDDSAESLLLAIIIVAPGFESSGNKNQYSSENYITSSKTEYEGPNGKLETSFKWNRETDLVTINKKEFKRADGNVFVMKLVNPKDKELQCVQVPGNIDGNSATQILDSVRQNLSVDQETLEVIKELREPE
jgi:hypothetical protein